MLYINGTHINEIKIYDGITAKELNAKINAVNILTGKMPKKIMIEGHYDCKDGEVVFINYSEKPVISIGTKWLTVDLGKEGFCMLDPQGSHSCCITIYYEN